MGGASPDSIDRGLRVLAYFAFALVANPIEKGQTSASREIPYGLDGVQSGQLIRVMDASLE